VNLSPLLSLIKAIPIYHQLTKELCQGKNESNLVLLDAAKPYLIAALYQELLSLILMICAEPKSSRKFYDELQNWAPDPSSVYLFPEPDALPYEDLPSDITTTGGRLQVLSTLTSWQKTVLYSQKPPLIVASAPSVVNKTLSFSQFATACHTLHTGMSLDLLHLLAKWQAMGYELEEIVEIPGTVSRRGDIVDIFPLDSHLPVRVEFFGNQIESIRLFEPQSQRSLKPITSITIVPAKENLGHEQNSFSTNTGCIIDYLAEETLLIIDNPEDIKITLEELDKKANELRRVKIEQKEITEDSPRPYFTWLEFWEKMTRTKKRLILWSWDTAQPSFDTIPPFPFTLAPSYGGKLDLLVKDIKAAVKENKRVIIVSHQAQRLSQFFQDNDILTPVINQIEKPPISSSITLLQGSLAEGWVMKGGFALLTDTEVFGFVKQRRLTKKRPVQRQWLFSQIFPGDYVVHIDHGIGKFSGLTTMSLDKTEREYLVIDYAAGDRLYVPTDQVDRLSRYIGASDKPPVVSRLGTQEWARTKQKIKESVINIAQELLALYATREVITGFPFSPDSIWQQELEASFPYLETPDQLETIQAVKEDMEKAKPMDRLVCGDVGYGKTEVALRAAFKAVMDNKQVAFLVPTTVLAQQHFNTFTQRLQAFPIRVEMLSRFCSEKEQQTILEGLADGTVDICIGTHRLLQKDVLFKNLGVVIIDEEQRFGVVHKERLKQMRQEVDVLILSATPIPRTLHMSLAGIKDISIMETPPDERLPVKTYVSYYDDQLVRGAIIRELERNGQVFFVHNRIQNISNIANKLQNLVPEAKIAIAHGQMPEEELEKVMIDFTAGKSDILVSTTIIESGLDIPNVNTLIVNQADRLGLTQLYQLRGRIGRGSNRAYAYFLFDKGKRLTPQAQKRLRTIFEATELGAGFGIAMKDLEIRGAGNLLGVEQSGHIAAVGFDLYCRLLAEAVEELKAREMGKSMDKKAELPSPVIALPLPAYIPEEYVPDINTRIALYYKLARVKQKSEIDDIAHELRDRFGVLPQPVKNLLDMLEIKLLCISNGVESTTSEAKQIIIKFSQGRKLRHPPPELLKAGIKIGSTQIRLNMNYFGSKWLEALKQTLQELAVNSVN